jgi:ABC-type antimicrobial peptide transport system permease subunit
MDPRLPLSYSHSLQQALDETVVARRAITLLLTSFAGLALLLSVIGVFAVLASTVAERRREIGIRIALGARDRDVYRLVLTKGLSTTVIGLGLGALGAVALSGSLERFLFDVRPSDPGTYLVAGGLFVAAALLACVLPAWHAVSVDPLESVRAQ